MSGVFTPPPVDGFTAEALEASKRYPGTKVAIVILIGEENSRLSVSANQGVTGSEVQMVERMVHEFAGVVGEKLRAMLVPVS